jgi:branched-chain amino acid transport system ATP-binding protein
MGDAEAQSSNQPRRSRSPRSGEYREHGRGVSAAATSARSRLLEIRGLKAGYGAGHVLFAVDLDVRKGETVALVGRNGAGKTTTLGCVMGMDSIARSGSIKVEGRETIGMPAYEIARLGVGLVPEGRRVFASLTVEENLRVAARTAANARSGEEADTQASAWSPERVFEVFPILVKVRKSKGAWLSGGEQQVLALARALVTNPKLLLLDEPSEGLAPRLVETLAEQLKAVRSAGVTMLLAEQHVGLVEELASRVYALERGVTARRSGSADE